MKLGKKINNFLMLGIIYMMMFQHIVPHHHHAHDQEEIGIENIADHHGHSHAVHSHDYIWRTKDNRVSKETFKLAFINTIESIQALGLFSTPNYNSYKENTFDYLLLVNRSLRAPPSLG
jgi:hypothetical protein